MGLNFNMDMTWEWEGLILLGFSKKRPKKNCTMVPAASISTFFGIPCIYHGLDIKDRVNGHQIKTPQMAGDSEFIKETLVIMGWTSQMAH